MCFYHAVLLTAVLRRTVGILSDEETEAEVRQLTLRDGVGQWQNQGSGLGPSTCKTQALHYRLYHFPPTHVSGRSLMFSTRSVPALLAMF